MGNGAIEKTVGLFDLAREISDALLQAISDSLGRNHMRNYMLKIVFTFSVLLLGGLTAANAQIEEGSALRISIPHSFVVRDKTFPAGRYQVTPLVQSDGSTDILKLESVHGKEIAIFETTAKSLDKTARNTELKFDQIGDTYFLSQIVLKGDDQTTMVQRSASEERDLTAAAGY